MHDPYSWDWTEKLVREQCGPAYRAFHRAERRRHIAHFSSRTPEAERSHPFVAADWDEALPVGWGNRLAKLIPERSRHKHQRSGGSSQTLAVGLLGPALLGKEGERLIGPSGVFPALGSELGWQFEYSVGMGLLNEQPRTTDIDLLLTGESGVVCAEAKYMEKGMGSCSCPDPDSGGCAARVLGRPYWGVAEDVFGISGPCPGQTCRLSFGYQVVRNCAAALEMTDLRKEAIFALIYDARNPYFSGCGEWPGWVSWLGWAFDQGKSRVQFIPVSWQALSESLLPSLPKAVRVWAADKYGLAAPSIPVT